MKITKRIYMFILIIEFITMYFYYKSGELIFIINLLLMEYLFLLLDIMIKKGVNPFYNNQYLKLFYVNTFILVSYCFSLFTFYNVVGILYQSWMVYIILNLNINIKRKEEKK